ncbi:MAG TPA: DUF4162 domain-containing protein, partial [Sediminibacterium sp.]
TIIFSTHRMEQVEEICDHIVLVNMGRKILDGSVHNVKQQFKENKFSIKLHELPASAEGASFEVIDQKANALVVKIREGFRSNDVLRHFLDQQVTIESFHEILPSLNDIFIGLVEGTDAKTRAFQKV